VQALRFENAAGKVEPLSPGDPVVETSVPPVIDVRGVSKIFKSRRGRTVHEVVALSNVSLSISPREFVCLLGPSGCGKTTLIRLMNGLLQPDSGEVIVGGQGPAAPGPKMGFVFQSFRLLPWRTVLDNVQFPLQIQRVDKRLRLERAHEYVKLVGLSGFEHSYPHELSGGMQQRVGLARALCIEPEILLMDEPFGALDAQTREFMQIGLSQIWEAKRTAVVFVTHSLDEALFLADRIVLLRPRPGAVEEILDVGLPRPRWSYDFRAEPAYISARADLWQRIQRMMAGQPEIAMNVAGESRAAVGRE
jgi:NitT/TauT family transport system ATP-binding protein